MTIGEPAGELGADSRVKHRCLTMHHWEVCLEVIFLQD